jgi:hypothetical protein
MSPDAERAFIEELDPNTLHHRWTWVWLERGLWWFEATVSVGDEESERSNEAQGECK